MFRTLTIALLLIGLSPLAALAHDVSLRGTSWMMSDGSGRSITFGNSGRVSGFAGCNRFFGRYAQWGESLRITVSGSTRMGCFGSKGASDDRFLGLLAATRRANVADGKLYLIGRSKAILATMRRR